MGFEYDPNGNMVNDWTRRLTYDADNRLVKVVSGTVTTSFVYDGDGRMVVRAVQDGASTVTTYYVGGHYEVQLDGLGELATKYYYANGKRIAFRKGGNAYYVHSDNLGSANKITDSTGAMKNSYLYYPWGGSRDKQELVDYDYEFNGQRLISSAGVYYYSDGKSYGRFYDPALARWLQADSMVPKPGDPQAYNRYSYGANNPLGFTDPSGHADQSGALSMAKYECSTRGGCDRIIDMPADPARMDLDAANRLLGEYEIQFTGDIRAWTAKRRIALGRALAAVKAQLGEAGAHELYHGLKVGWDATLTSDQVMAGGIKYDPGFGATLIVGPYAEEFDDGRSLTAVMVHEMGHITYMRDKGRLEAFKEAAGYDSQGNASFYATDYAKGLEMQAYPGENYADAFMVWVLRASPHLPTGTSPLNPNVKAFFDLAFPKP